MLRRLLYFLIALAIIAVIAGLVYLNPQQTSFTYMPENTVTLPVSLLILAAVVAGMVLTFLAALLREGRRAMHEWQVYREKRAAERHLELKSEARALALGGNFNKARALLKKAIDRSTKDVDSLADYADTYILEGKPEEAKLALEQGQARFGNDPLLLFGLARAHMGLEEHGAAITVFERLLAEYPNSLQVLEPLRNALFSTKSWKKAVEVQQKICELRRDDATERNRLLGARLEASRGEDKAGRDTMLRNILAIAPDFNAATIERAELMTADGGAKKALKMLEKALAKDPRIELLDSFERIAASEEESRILKLYRGLLTWVPDTAKDKDAVKLRAARYLLRSGEVDQAKTALAGIENARFAATAAVLRGLADQQDGKAEEATAAFNSAIEGAAFPAMSFQCSACDAAAESWSTRCGNCGAWSSLTV